MDIPEDHPRYQSLLTRHRLEAGVEQGITSLQGLIAEGRGEAFDYLLGEETIPSAQTATTVASAALLRANHPVISVNGNVAALVPDEIVDLSQEVNADIEVNLFNRTEDRVQKIADHLMEHGAASVKGVVADARIPGISHERAKVDADGIYSADVVLVPLEDGDRTSALVDMEKVVIVVDLNPLSRSAQTATIPIVDNVIRVFPNLIREARGLQDEDADKLQNLVTGFDSQIVLNEAENRIRTGIRR